LPPANPPVTSSKRLGTRPRGVISPSLLSRRDISGAILGPIHASRWTW